MYAFLLLSFFIFLHDSSVLYFTDFSSFDLRHRDLFLIYSIVCINYTGFQCRIVLMTSDRVRITWEMFKETAMTYLITYLDALLNMVITYLPAQYLFQSCIAC